MISPNNYDQCHPRLCYVYQHDPLFLQFIVFSLQDDVSGTGTVVVRSPRGNQKSSMFNNQSSLVWLQISWAYKSTYFLLLHSSKWRLLCFFIQSSSTYASTEDTSISGTVVYRGQHDDSDSPRTLKSRLGLQQRTFSAALEDSEINLSEVNRLINFELFYCH